MSSLLNGLNATQRQAAEHRDGPLLILAAAGSGKTRTLTHRAAHLVHHGIASHRILVVTFTNKAARELTERLNDLLGNEHRVWTMTFHALCLRMLRESGDLIGVQKNFTIFDIADVQKTIRQLYRDSKAYSIAPETDEDKENERKEINRIRNAISRYKNDGTTPQSLLRSNRSDLRVIGKIWTQYEATLQQMNMLDFDDLMLKAALVLDTPEGKERWGSRFRYVMIDEYQDTNVIQDQIALRLATTGNLCVVGDDSQSIYSWRGANVANILTFADRWPNSRTVKLEHNYRSQANIIACAEAVIASVSERTDKITRTVKPASAPVRIVAAKTDLDEAQYVAEQISDLRKQHVPGSEIAVMYRTKQQSHALQTALRRYGVSFSVVGDIEFNRRVEVQAVRAYLALLANPNDAHAFTKAVAFPKRGVGKATVTKILEAANAAHDGNVLKAATGLLEAGSISGTAREGLLTFMKLLTDATQASASFSLTKILTALITTTGIAAQLSSGNAKQRGQLGYIQQLLDSADQYEGAAKNTIPMFLEATSLRDLSDQHQNQTVSLMTIHATKGMEFDHVFFTGFEHEILNYDEDDENIRLVYVAITRAREHLTITHARQRKIWGETRTHRASSFVQHFPDEATVQQATNTKPRPKYQGHRNQQSIPEERRRLPRSSRPVRTTDANTFSPGDCVVHTKFGSGTVASVENDAVTVNFQGGPKKLLANYLSLQ